ncbi:MAG: thiol reductase thioredoxin [Calditrichaeota bacterium]|nr:thiol reductase thioredoxin [Calditrichota bacterium]MCB9391491.1 thiol reductase thioredoxin [Calditrichota bacterium]
MSNLKTITDANFEETILRADRLAVLDFGAEWCAPCKKVHAMLETMAPDWEDKAVIGEIDIAANPETPRKYGVLNIPQVLFFKNGQLVETVNGVLPKAKLEEKFRNHAQ